MNSEDITSTAASGLSVSILASIFINMTTAAVDKHPRNCFHRSQTVLMMTTCGYLYIDKR